MAPATRPDADSFLRSARMHPAKIDFGACVAAFLEEMESGLRGETSTLPMIPNYVETLRTVPAGRRAIALDAGGTNLRAALVSFDAGGKPLVEGLARGIMPGSEGEVSRDGFFEAIASLLGPLAGAADRIGFVFSYPAVIQPSRDARIQRFSKEVKASAVEGQLLGEGLCRAMGQAGMPVPSRVVILNDTAAALLAGLRASPGRRFGGYIGFVCGTGANVSYVESNAALTKVAGLDPAGSQAVNVEAGTFGRAPTGVYDDEFDATTDAPGRYRFEKMVSGGYLGGLCLVVLRGAASAGCLSAEAGRALAGISSLSTRQANDFLVFPDAGGNPLDSLAPVDAEVAARIIDRLVERSALFSAVCLSAVLLKCGGGRDPRAPVRITADGTTFWQLKDYRPRVDAHMRGFLRGRNERHYEIASVEDAPLLGAAIAGLTN